MQKLDDKVAPGAPVTSIRLSRPHRDVPKRPTEPENRGIRGLRDADKPRHTAGGPAGRENRSIPGQLRYVIEQMAPDRSAAVA